jgi:hypothetical protein
MFPAPSRWATLAQLFGLCGFAIAQPAFDLLGDNVGFLVAHQATPAVLFGVAIGIILIPPLALWGLGQLPPFRDRPQLWIGALSATTALPVVSSVLPVDTGWVAVALSLILGTAAAFAYARFLPVRSFSTLLALAPLVFISLFLLASPAARLLLDDVASSTATPRIADDAAVPVVVIIFDELSAVSLRDRRGEIDALRYPNFARLAGRSIWFRNASAVAGWTLRAVPALATGRVPDRGLLASAVDHPESLFSLLGDNGYSLHVLEGGTMLVPSRLRAQRVGAPGSAGALAAILRDLPALYLHAILPRDLTGWLPDLAMRWRGFGEALAAGANDGGPDARVRDFRRFVDEIEACPERCLHYLHTALPHHPWEYLPSGQRYGPANVEGLRVSQWERNPWWGVHAQQRHLLQVGFVDRLLGELVARLEQVGLYDRSLLIVTSDHGISFRPGTQFRRPSRAAPEEVALVPLFVKLPHQESGRRDELPVKSTDVLPTVAGVVGVELSGSVEGCSLLVESCDRRKSRLFFAPEPLDVDPALHTLRSGIDRKHAIFGSGTDDLYRIGRHGDLLGRPISELLAGAQPDASFELASDPRPLSAEGAPARVRGVLRYPGPTRSPHIAIVSNGHVVGVGKAVRRGEGEFRFSSMVRPARSDSAQVTGAFSYFLVSGKPGSERLHPLDTTGP